MRPLSIIHVDTGNTWRGGQEALLTLARGLRERGHRQTIVCPVESRLAERAGAVGFTVVSRCPRTGDIVHAHSGHAQNQAYWATLGAPVRRVVTRHVAFQPCHPWVHRLKYTWTCHGIIAVSGSVRAALIAAGVPAGKIEVIHTGVAVPDSPPRDRKRFGLAGDDFVVGHMGAFTAEKGQDVAVDAAALLRVALPRARMILAGDGPSLEDIRRRAPDNVVFPGFVSDAPAFFAALDLFIMPSRSEAWGLAALQAMAHGVPVIASQVGGLPEMIEEGDGGWLVPAGDPVALARAITIAAADRDRLRAAGEKARARARVFSVERMVEQTEAFYHRLVADR